MSPKRKDGVVAPAKDAVDQMGGAALVSVEKLRALGREEKKKLGSAYGTFRNAHPEGKRAWEAANAEDKEKLMCRWMIDAAAGK